MAENLISNFCSPMLRNNKGKKLRNSLLALPNTFWFHNPKSYGLLNL